ncbi:MAG: hypothetical protein K0U93_10055, partial [Gammaproteobacteria bacterium]|nr:hypothetical protein [Gammaproteobacteria bacterium]
MLLNQESILSVINSKAHQSRVEWTARLILQELGIETTKSRRRSCTTLLRRLWKDGQIKRKAARRDNLEAVYCRSDVSLAEYCVPCD